MSDGRAHVVASLRVTPAMLRAMTAGCDAGIASTAPAPGEWSIIEIVRHLVEGDRDTFLPRLRRMLAEDTPRFESGRRPEGDRADLATLLDAFADARGQAVRALEGLDETAWRRQGVSPSRGMLSVETYARTMAEHDTEHLQQLHDVRTTLGLLPRRCEARLALGVPELIAALGHSPARLHEAVAGLEPDTARRRPAEGEWSIVEVAAHLHELEARLFLPRLRRIAQEEQAVFETFDPEAWARERDRRHCDLAAEVAGFAAARAETIAFLRALTPEQASRLGLSAYFGPLTLAQYATHVADHDLEHLAQIGAARAIVGPPLPAAARSVADALTALGLTGRVIALERPARTAVDAAAAVGCSAGQIVKSLVFRGQRSGRAWLVLTSGANRVDEAAVARLAGEPLEKGDADFVRDHTGFAIGGVPPFGHRRPLETLVDRDLLGFPDVWAAAGHPNAVFRITPDELLKATGGTTAAVH